MEQSISFHMWHSKSEMNCLAIISDPYNKDHFTEVQNEIIHKPHYQTEIQKDDIILIVTPEIMSQIQKKMYYSENHAGLQI